MNVNGFLGEGVFKVKGIRNGSWFLLICKAVYPLMASGSTEPKGERG